MTILCPIDFSAVTEELVMYAAALAAGTRAELRLLHVLETAGEPLPDLQVAYALARHRETARHAGAHVTTAVAQGEAGAEIVADARLYPADMIVIGAHGRTGLTRFLMGSTAETVVRTASCVTLLVKPACLPQVLRPTG